ncbi:MAG: redox-sensing transcriptional repressor Rex [Treponema sp.]|uniref:redox-sensing transcriptional repressor Rex n=1 Tax=Treponema sp. TaxID=166 RepID=UPI00298E1D5B|nr:redox-sensing transcriptional repressor Rex [Treponema sp.]MCR5387450.1 redox-sensing transcriptional repressor Rex [Treponema sp.]
MRKVSEATRRRLVEIAQILSQTKEKRITSVQLESLTGWSNTSIRKDISAIEYTGGVSNGYDTENLLKAICESLGIASDEEDSKKRGIFHRCCIVGLGKLGAALLENSIFYDTAYSIIAGFDANVNRTEILSASFPLYPASKMSQVIPEQKIEYAILTVPNESAQSMAERLVSCGIKGIVNYTSVILSLSKDVAVENVSPVTAMNNLSAKISLADLK